MRAFVGGTMRARRIPSEREFLREFFLFCAARFEGKRDGEDSVRDEHVMLYIALIMQ
jgi:hypothetical protein